MSAAVFFFCIFGELFCHRAILNRHTKIGWYSRCRASSLDTHKVRHVQWFMQRKDGVMFAEDQNNQMELTPDGGWNERQYTKCTLKHTNSDRQRTGTIFCEDSILGFCCHTHICRVFPQSKSNVTNEDMSRSDNKFVWTKLKEKNRKRTYRKEMRRDRWCDFIKVACPAICCCWCITHHTHTAHTSLRTRNTRKKTKNTTRKLIEGERQATNIEWIEWWFCVSEHTCFERYFFVGVTHARCLASHDRIFEFD